MKVRVDMPRTGQNIATTLTHTGRIVSRYGLVVVLAWIGFGKYVKMEARVLIEHSPLMSWILHVLSFTTVSRGLGTMEIAAAALIAVRPLWPRASAVGSALAVVLFLGTLSFLFTTPGVVATHAAGIPVLSAQPGQFLLKDLVLMGVALWTFGDSLGAARSHTVIHHSGLLKRSAGDPKRALEISHESYAVGMTPTVWFHADHDESAT